MAEEVRATDEQGLEPRCALTTILSSLQSCVWVEIGPSTQAVASEGWETADACCLAEDPSSPAPPSQTCFHGPQLQIVDSEFELLPLASPALF